MQQGPGDKPVAHENLWLAGGDSVPGFQAFVVSHTHSDFAWADSIAGCLDKNVAAVAKSVELAGQYPDFRFCMEHMLAVREYLRRTPDKLETVRKLMQEGRFEAGGFFTGPWELTSGAEGLVRQLYFGKRWVKTTLGVDSLVVWNVDVAGHTAQLPQILSKAGIKGLVISAGSTGPYLLQWEARDGSSVLTWRTPWGYGAGAALGLRQTNLSDMISTMPRFVADVCRNAQEYHLPRIGFIADGTDIQAPSELVVENLRRWNAQKRFPTMTYSSTAAAFAAVENHPIPAAAGEMPSPWDAVQSQGNECFMADRRLDGRVLAAEKFAAFCTLISPGYTYPRERFAEIWWNRLYTFDHNWGGSYGEESDQIKTGKIQAAARITEEILGPALQAIAGAIKFHKLAGTATPVVVFNSLSWERKDIVTSEIPATPGRNVSLTLCDSQGVAVPSQILSGQTASSNVQFAFCADVPSLGYATYYATWTNKQPAAASPFTVDGATQTFENSFYRVQLDPAKGQIKSLIDRQTGRELVQQDSKFGFNELVAMEDTDEDIGMHLTGNQWLGREHPSIIKVVENGPVRLVIEVAGQLLDASSRQQQIILYAGLPKIDLVTKLDWEGKPNVQLYQEFPLNVAEPTVRYAVPYGWEQFGTEMKYAEPWFSHDSPPVAQHRWRGLRGWVELANDQTSVTLASQCNYAAFKDVSADPQPGYLIQPLLLRTVRSCGGNHFHYTQKGPQEFRFAFQTQADPTRLGEELDSPLLACGPNALAGNSPNLPERHSFLGISAPNVHVAVVKQAEDGQGLILRLVEMRERTQATSAQLRTFRPIKRALRTSIIEEDQQEIAPQGSALTVSLAPAGIETIRLAF
jgi:alpha-mannosidase